ncbi:hypothetical protein [Paraburkholderia sp. GAS82]|jgi:hypothetical protein|uniref:hypothetical protein n=1 Tax=Paraburkholderia sp. GAS82 TaxID=3035137 RepID=UPI003D1AB2C5
MPAVFLKRTLMWSIPAALIFMALQYHDSGKINVYTLAVTLVAFLLWGGALEVLNSWWKRTFCTSTFGLYASAVFWTALAICLFVFFYRML